MRGLDWLAHRKWFLDFRWAQRRRMKIADLHAWAPTDWTRPVPNPKKDKLLEWAMGVKGYERYINEVSNRPGQVLPLDDPIDHPSTEGYVFTPDEGTWS